MIRTNPNRANRCRGTLPAERIRRTPSLAASLRHLSPVVVLVALLTGCGSAGTSSSPTPSAVGLRALTPTPGAPGTSSTTAFSEIATPTATTSTTGARSGRNTRTPTTGGAVVAPVRTGTTGPTTGAPAARRAGPLRVNIDLRHLPSWRLSAPLRTVAAAGSAASARILTFGPAREGIPDSPGSFDVGADGQVWVNDPVNDQVVEWCPSHAARVCTRCPAQGGGICRVLRTPSVPLDIAVGRRGVLYVNTYVAGHEPRGAVDAFSATGRFLWSAPTGRWSNTDLLRIGPGGRPWLVDLDGVWRPVTDIHLRPLSAARQQRLARTAQPLSGGRSVRVRSSTRFTIASSSGRAILDATVRCAVPSGFATPMTLVPSTGDLVVILSSCTTVSGRTRSLTRVIDLSPTGRLIGQVALDPFACSGECVTAVRLGEDGHLYELQTSPHWGVRVVRYTLRGTVR